MIKDIYDYAIEQGLVIAKKDGTIYKRYANGDVREIKKKNNPNMYEVIALKINGKYKNLVAHRIVAKIYLPNPHSKPQVNHIDGNKSNNHINNLEWCTAKENTQHALGMSPKCPYCGVSTRASHGICPDCRYSIAKSKGGGGRIDVNRIKKELRDVDPKYLTEREKEIINLRQAGKSYQQIGDVQGVSKQRIQQIIKRIIMKRRD